MYGWGRYVPVAERRAKAARKVEKLRKQGKDIQPIEIEGRTIARSFWGKAWCKHLESFSDYENRLPRGRTYVRNGSVCHLEIQPGHIEALVSGSSLYTVSIDIKTLKPNVWKAIKKKCSGQIGSMLELLQGKLSSQVMGIVTDRENGLFPQPGEIDLKCSCPDWAIMCKHVASVLYGVGSRLDERPDLLFLLRGVEAQDLIAAEIALPGAAASDDAIAPDQLGDIFGIDIEADEEPEKRSKATRSRERKKKVPASASKKTKTRSKAKVKAKDAPKKKTRTVATLGKPRTRPSGKSVARFRKSLGLTVPQFAEKLGVTAPTVYRWEAIPGKIKMQARPLHALATLRKEMSKK